MNQSICKWATCLRCAWDENAAVILGWQRFRPCHEPLRVDSDARPDVRGEPRSRALTGGVLLSTRTFLPLLATL